MISGASIVRRCLQVSLADELDIDLMPSSVAQACDYLTVWARYRFSWKEQKWLFYPDEGRTSNFVL